MVIQFVNGIAKKHFDMNAGHFALAIVKTGGD